ncbi:MAG: hypothetical protein HC824_17135 [Synechococcales cyanobacterium RM1_1_8]|nr:hypothetical protein [Synechococcales cyanobacterium RM1_1_8]
MEQSFTKPVGYQILLQNLTLSCANNTNKRLKVVDLRNVRALTPEFEWKYAMAEGLPVLHGEIYRLIDWPVAQLSQRFDRIKSFQSIRLPPRERSDDFHPLKVITDTTNIMAASICNIKYDLENGKYISVGTGILSLKSQNISYIATMNMATSDYIPLRVSNLKDGTSTMLFSEMGQAENSYQLVFVKGKYYISAGSNLSDDEFEEIIQNFIVIE